MSAVLIQGDATQLPLADESVDLIVTSPPYFALRAYESDGSALEDQIGGEPTPQQYLEALWMSMTEMVRVLKPTGSIFVNIGDKYAGSGGHNNAGIGAGSPDFKHSSKRRQAPAKYNKSSEFDTGKVKEKSLMGIPWRFALGCIEQGALLRAEIVWHKPNGVPDPTPDRVGRMHEQVFHFSKSERYFFDPVETQRPSVWKMATEPLRISLADLMHYDLPTHSAAFPTELPRRCILGWCPPGGVVLDPFVGSGTVPMVAHVLGCRGIGVELSPSYLRLAHWRIFRSGDGLRVESRTHGERQGSLL